MGKRAGTCLAAFYAAIVIAAHAWAFGWGPPPGETSLRASPVGFAWNNKDNLSYAAWARQATQGHWLFIDLYTSKPHERLCFNPYFLLAGRLARLTGRDPILVMNALGVVAMVVFIGATWRTCRQLQQGPTTALVATCLALGGGGVSWLRRWLVVAGPAGIPLAGASAPDMSYLDFFPATSGLTSPYQAACFAMLAVMTMLLTRLDDPREPLTRLRAYGLTGLAMFLATSRPYEPLLVLVAYGCLAGASWLARVPAGLLRRRLALLACLALAILPATAYGAWVATQPAWKYVARALLRIAGQEWLAALFLAWALGAAGLLAIGRRWLATAYAFPAIWAMACGLLLLVFNTGLTKCCAGCSLPLALLAGPAIQAILERLQGRKALRAALVVATIAFALATPAYLCVALVRNAAGVGVSRDLLKAIEVIRDRDDLADGMTLADDPAGELAPGLGGLRVFSGHWALTDGHDNKEALLYLLGFHRPDATPPDAARGTGWKPYALGLAAQLRAGDFRGLLTRKDGVLAGDRALLEKGRVAYDGAAWLVVEVTPALAEALAARAQGLAD
jgi:hypothetical protein